MKQIKLTENSIFNITKTDVFGNILPDKVISSSDFIYQNTEILLNVSVDKNYSEYLFEYSQVLKSIVKNELLEEMQKSIHNIETFYN